MVSFLFWLIHCSQSQKIYFFPLPLTHDKSTSKHDMQTLRQIVRRGGMIIPCVYSLFAVLMSCFFGVRATFFFFLRYRRSTFLSSEQTLPFHFQDFSITRVRAFCHVTPSSHYHNSTQSPRLSPHHTEVVTTRQDDTPLRDHQCTLRQDHRTSNATCRADTPHVDTLCVCVPGKHSRQPQSTRKSK